MYGVDGFKSARAAGHTRVHTGEPWLQVPLARTVWVEPDKRFGSTKAEVTHAGRRTGSQIPLITVSRKSSPP